MQDRAGLIPAKLPHEILPDQPSQIGALLTEFDPGADTGVDAHMHGGTRQKEP